MPLSAIGYSCEHALMYRSLLHCFRQYREGELKETEYELIKRYILGKQGFRSVERDYQKNLIDGKQYATIKKCLSMMLNKMRGLGAITEQEYRKEKARHHF